MGLFCNCSDRLKRLEKMVDQLALEIKLTRAPLQPGGAEYDLKTGELMPMLPVATVLPPAKARAAVKKIAEKKVGVIKVNQKVSVDLNKEVVSLTTIPTHTYMEDIEMHVRVDLPPLGSLSKKFESGRSGSSTVSSGRGDPGGVSYGTYQLSSKKGTCDVFVKQMKYTKYFRGHQPGSKEFSALWRKLAKNDEGKTFEKAQHEFIKRTHFDPVRKWATKLGIKSHPVIDQVLWSMGVQHSFKGNKIMLKQVSKAGMPLKMKKGGFTYPEMIIRNLFIARKDYIVSCVKRSLHTTLFNRYNREQKDALKML